MKSAVFYNKSLNHIGEEVCGDNFQSGSTEDSKIMVLSDGLGSGIKASILAILSTEIITTMIEKGVDIEEVVYTITKTLIKYVPKIVTALSAANALSPESRASWAKLASNESLTVKDWQNIAAGCSALAGVSRGAVGHFNAHTMAKGTKTKDFNITASDGK